VAEVAVVVAAFAILGISWPGAATTRRLALPRHRPHLAGAPPRDRHHLPGRIADTSNVRRMVLGEGPDAIPLIAWGRIPGLEGRTVRFPASPDDVSVGR
jgi:hypothetical protein